MATTRLRRAFRYPADDSDGDDTPKDLDEEEQEKLIAKLRHENEERNDQYMRIFLAIPLVSAMSFIPAIAFFGNLQAKFISLLSVTSLVATAYILLFLPNEKTQPANRQRLGQAFTPEPGPVQKYLLYLNSGLSFLIALNALHIQPERGVHDGFWMLCLLPALVLSIIVIARRVMLSVDVGELEGLKYRYKGA